MLKRTKPLLTDSALSSLNYLIAIVSFIALACLSIGIAASSRNIQALQRWILISFLILFSLFGLIFSVWLILRQAHQNAVSIAGKKTDWKIMPHENQRAKLNKEVREIASILETPEEQFSDLVSAYIVAVDLALRQIQEEANMPLMRYVRIGNAEFDAVLIKQDFAICIELVFLVTPVVPQEKINLLLNKTLVAQKTFKQINFEAKTKLLLVLVTQLDRTQEKELRSNLIKKFSSTPVDVDIRLMDFESLQKIYMIG
ncbi:hypothetical protein BH24ACI2_BH24ACI2_04110 [soil metagenome]|nr:hypothetical protein [Acidobacteriota bacterium]